MLPNGLGFFDEGCDLAAPGFYASALAADPTVLRPAAFRSLRFTQLEDEAVWTQDWICIGAHEAIPNPGDLLPFTIGTHGIHVQRVEGGLAARFNKAQHGGCRMVPVQCQTGAKTKCSFTSCGYSRDRGAIAATELGDGTPEMHQYLGLRPERLLTPACRSWGPLIFVHLDPARDWPEGGFAALNRLIDAFGNHKPARSPEIWREFGANWKLLGAALAAGEPLARDDEAGWIATRTVTGWGEEARAAWLFPNLVLIATATQTLVAVLQQTAIGQTLCRLSVHGEQLEGALDRWLAEIEARAAAAVAEHGSLARFGTSHAPETIGRPLPRQTSPLGAWMQHRLAARVAAAPFAEHEQARLRNPGG